jgi:hypothetical protein
MKIERRSIINMPYEELDECNCLNCIHCVKSDISHDEYFCDQDTSSFAFGFSIEGGICEKYKEEFNKCLGLFDYWVEYGNKKEKSG